MIKRSIDDLVFYRYFKINSRKLDYIHFLRIIIFEIVPTRAHTDISPGPRNSQVCGATSCPSAIWVYPNLTYNHRAVMFWRFTNQIENNHHNILIPMARPTNYDCETSFEYLRTLKPQNGSIIASGSLIIAYQINLRKFGASIYIRITIIYIVMF